MLSIAPKPKVDGTAKDSQKPTAPSSLTPPMANSAAGSGGAENRDAPRRPASAVPSITGLRISPHGVDATLVNISESGVLAECGERLKPGDTVRVAIIAETVQNTLVVPSAALLNSDTGRPKVMVVTSDNVAHERMVSVGIRQGDRVKILGGVQEGEQVVVSGGLGLDDKGKVVIEQPKEEDEDEDENK